MSNIPESHFRFAAPAMDDRNFWQGLRRHPRHAALFEHMEAVIAAVPAQPPIPLATDYLAAQRDNNRKLLDNRWQRERPILGALALRRLVSGLDEHDLDDQLLNWLWAFLTEPSWVVSAHLPNNDLPSTSDPTLDLASCEMAAFFAEMREVLKPWMDSVSGTLADSIIFEIDRRVLTPYGEGKTVRWQDAEKINNWLGVCAGSILAACESLAAQGHPRPKARERALKGLNEYLEKGFSPHGECDEGLGYWNYGMTFAGLGWSRLKRDELAANVDFERLCLVADYPRRAHLFGNNFYSGNDAGLVAPPPISLLPWLAAATGEDWLLEWPRLSTPDANKPGGAPLPASDLRHFGQILRVLTAPDYKDLQTKMPQSTLKSTHVAQDARFLPDQQTAILRAATSQGELLATLSGGDNAERHNHNDLGHFNIALNGHWIVPDLGAPMYTADFFGPRRYTYLPASSRGHCCPLIGEYEQQTGPEAAGRVLSWQPESEEPILSLDLTAAYPTEAGLQRWTRTLTQRKDGETARMEINDEFQTEQPKTQITHLIWSVEPPQQSGNSENGNAHFQLGPLRCEISPAPASVAVVEHAAEDLRLRMFNGQILYCIEAVYVTDGDGQAQIETVFAA